MATLSELVQTVSGVEGIDAATVALIARNIREAGFIRTGGRGTSAAMMSVTDAANLLIAVNATRTAAQAPRAVSSYRELLAYEYRSRLDPRPPEKYGTLGEAIEQLIEAAGKGELPEQLLGKGVSYDLQEAFAKGDVHIDLKFRISDLYAFLGIARVPESDVVSAVMAEQYLAIASGWDIVFAFYPPKQRGALAKKKKRAGDQTEERTIGYTTLREVGELLRPELLVGKEGPPGV